MASGNKLTVYILIALVLGVIAGLSINQWVPDPAGVVEHFSLVTTLFLRLIKMIIAPLVFSTLVVGIAKMGDVAVVGRVGLKAMVWFVSASLVSLTLGLLLVNFFQPGASLNIPLPDANAQSGIVATGMSLAEFINHLVPTSIVDGMARNEILQIVVFSVFFGVGCSAVGEKARVLVDAIEGLSYVMLRVTMLVMWFAPIAVFAAVSAALAKSGVDLILTYLVFMAEFYLGILRRGPCSANARLACFAPCASQPCWPLPPHPAKRPIRRRWRNWRNSVAATAWLPSCCRSATPSIWMAR